MSAAAPPSNRRRITEADPDFCRVKAHTIRLLTASLRTFVSDLKRHDPHAQSSFIARHIRLMQEAYQQAHQEGQRDYWQSVSAESVRHLRRHQVAAQSYQTMQHRLHFYVTSVAKMAREGKAAIDAPAAVALDDSTAQSWVDGLNVRINLQADLTWSAFQDGYVDAGAEDGARPFLWLWWMLGPAKQHCDQCPTLAEGSPYGAPGTGENELTQTPGDGQTDCGAACKCSWTYGPGPSYAYTSYYPRTFADWTANLPQNSPFTDPLQLPLLASMDLSDTQKSILDRYRNNAAKWDAIRGQWPEIGQMFAPGNALASVDWEQLDADQRGALYGVMSAIQDWIGAVQ